MHTADGGLVTQGEDVLKPDRHILMQHYWGPRCHPLDSLDRFNDKLAIFYDIKSPSAIGALNKLRECKERKYAKPKV